jgi:hypothetical protein
MSDEDRDLKHRVSAVKIDLGRCVSCGSDFRFVGGECGGGLCHRCGCEASWAEVIKETPELQDPPVDKVPSG